MPRAPDSWPCPGGHCPPSAPHRRPAPGPCRRRGCRGRSTRPSWPWGQGPRGSMPRRACGWTASLGLVWRRAVTDTSSVKTGERLQAYPIQRTGRVTHVACCPPIDSGRRQFRRDSFPTVRQRIVTTLDYSDARRAGRSTSWRRTLAAYVALTKPRIIELLLGHDGPDDVPGSAGRALVVARGGDPHRRHAVGRIREHLQHGLRPRHRRAHGADQQTAPGDRGSDAARRADLRHRAGARVDAVVRPRRQRVVGGSCLWPRSRCMPSATP
jgi:hypothetical protein